MKETEKKEDVKINEKMKELVIARIEAQLPSNLRLAMGSYGSMTKDEMIEHVRKEDEIGKRIVLRHMLFLKALRSGEFVKAISSVEDNE